MVKDIGLNSNLTLCRVTFKIRIHYTRSVISIDFFFMIIQL